MENNGLPLYIQLKKLFKEKIEDGKWEINAKIPSERSLEQKYGVSRMTIRKALDDLKNEGILIRRQGSGTFVNDKKIEEKLVKLKGFTQDMLSRGLIPSTSVISTKEINPDKEIRDKLKLNIGDKVFKLDRVRCANGKPMAFETAYLNAKYCPGILSKDLESSLYSILRNQYDLKLNNAEQTLEADIASEIYGELLDISEGDPVLILTRFTLNEENIPIEYVKSIYRGDKYKFKVILTD